MLKPTLLGIVPAVMPGASERDRATTDPAQPWIAGEADDGIDLLDALANLGSFGHVCS